MQKTQRDRGDKKLGLKEKKSFYEIKAHAAAASSFVPVTWKCCCCA